MSGTIGTILAAVETRLTALGYTATDEVFNFDAVPDSNINECFRIDVRQVSKAYYSDHLANPIDAIEIFIAFEKTMTPRAVVKTALDARETIEDDLINDETIRALDSDPLLTLDGEAEAIKELEDYIILRLVFHVDYLRSVAP